MRTNTPRRLALVTVWGLLTVAIGAQTGAPPAPAPPQPDYSKVEIKTTKLGNNFYMLEGQGGQIGVLTGPDGVFMVDTQFAPLTEKLFAAIKQISDGRIRFVVNTHVHGDHTGGDANFARLGATILARNQLRDRLVKGNAALGALPFLTYDSPLTMNINGEAVRLIPVPLAHTDGDTMVYFPGPDVLMTGDFFRSVGYPNIDRNNGGSLKGMVAGLDAAISVTTPNTRVLPGHGALTDRAGLTAHRDMIMGVRDKVAPLVKQGQTLEQVVAAKPTSAFDARVADGAPTVERFVGQVYAELKANP
jgi:cyclase